MNEKDLSMHVVKSCYLTGATDPLGHDDGESINDGVL